MFRWLFACSVVFASSALLEAGPKQKPNIVFIMADDLGYGDLGCYNVFSKVPTPNLNQFAKQGMRFTDAHSPSAVCTPTRYSVVTGRYCWRSKLKSGVLWGYSPLLIDPNRMTVASMLRAAGYTTAVIGKWHLGLGNEKKTDYSKPLRPGPLQVGFDYFFGIPASLDMEPYVFVENDRCVEQPTEMIKGSAMRRKGGKGFWRGGPIAPSFKHEDVLPTITKKAVTYLEKQANGKKPFFLYFPLSAPHTPWLPTKEFRNKSGAGYYGDFVTQVDASVGEVLKALDRLKLTENTLVIFTSDNGAHWLPSDISQYLHYANWLWRGQKADIWEGGHRVPFIVRWPGQVPADSRSDHTCCHTDFMATCAEIVGTKLPPNAGEDSFSLLPVIRNKQSKATKRPPVIHHSARGHFAIRDGDWVLIDQLGSGGFTPPRTVKPKKGGPTGQLYNLAHDSRQEVNLFLRRPDVVRNLQEMLTQIQKQGRSR